MDEAVGQLGEMLLGQREDEVVAAVAAEGERAVVLAEIFHRRRILFCGFGKYAYLCSRKTMM